MFHDLKWRCPSSRRIEFASFTQVGTLRSATTLNFIQDLRSLRLLKSSESTGVSTYSYNFLSLSVFSFAPSSPVKSPHTPWGWKQEGGFTWRLPCHEKAFIESWCLEDRGPSVCPSHSENHCSGGQTSLANPSGQKSFQVLCFPLNFCFLLPFGLILLF